VGSGVDNAVVTLGVLPGGDVVVGGSFQNAGTVAVRGIARLNPATNTWSALGAGLNNFVSSVVVLLDGDVIAAGYFTAAGGVPANFVARYNPGSNTWSSLGSGTNADVFYMGLLPGGDVLLSGYFTSAGGNPATNIARYNPGPTPLVVLVQPAPVATTPSGTAAFTVAVEGGGGGYRYQWQYYGMPISTLVNPTAQSPVLVLREVQLNTLGFYSCRVDSDCDVVGTRTVELSFVRPTCGPSDVAGPGQSPGSDGQLTADDIIVFLNRFFAGC
jgi:hypothetical protein